MDLFQFQTCTCSPVRCSMLASLQLAQDWIKLPASLHITSLHIDNYTHFKSLQLLTIPGHREKSDVLSYNNNVKRKFNSVD